MSSAICFNLDQSNILSSGNVLRLFYFNFLYYYNWVKSETMITWETRIHKLYSFMINNFYIKDERMIWYLRGDRDSPCIIFYISNSD